MRASGREGRCVGALAAGAEAARAQQGAGQGMAHQALGHTADLDQGFQIDTGLDAHLLAQKHQFLGGDVAGGAWAARERAAAQAGHGAVKAVHAHLERGMRAGHAHAARVVQVQDQVQSRPRAAHRAHQRFGARRRAPAHAVGQRDLGDGLAHFLGQRQRIARGGQHLPNRHVACVVAAEGRHHADPLHRHAVGLQRGGLLAHHRHVFGHAAVEVDLRECFGGADDQCAGHMQFVAERQRALQAGLAEPEGCVVDAGLCLHASHHGLRVGPARHGLGVDEGDGLEMGEAGVGERVDQGDLVRGGDGTRLDLEALARAFLADVDECWRVGHGIRLQRMKERPWPLPDARSRLPNNRGREGMSGSACPRLVAAAARRRCVRSS